MMSEVPSELSFADLKVGNEASFERTISVEDVAEFARLSGDFNPIHVDTSYAAGTQFGRPIAHGMLVGSLVSRLIAMHLPGKYALLLKETLEFRHPVYVGDSVVTHGSITRKSEATRIIELAVEIRNKEIIAVSGVAFVRVLQ